MRFYYSMSQSFIVIFGRYQHLVFCHTGRRQTKHKNTTEQRKLKRGTTRTLPQQLRTVSHRQRKQTNNKSERKPQPILTLIIPGLLNEFFALECATVVGSVTVREDEIVLSIYFIYGVVLARVVGDLLLLDVVNP